ncbi:hypothetical protein ACLB2K_041649 [Fragaria x ananassa]
MRESRRSGAGNRERCGGGGGAGEVLEGEASGVVLGELGRAKGSGLRVYDWGVWKTKLRESRRSGAGNRERCGGGGGAGEVLEGEASGVVLGELGRAQFVDDGNKPLYPGCTTHMRMAVIVKLYNIKTKHSMSESAYSDVLAAFAEFLLIIGCGTGTQRTENIAKSLTTAKPGQVFMLPYNSGDHWTLTVVDLDNDTVYSIDPVRRRIPCGDWAKIVKDAMVMANTARKRNGRSSMIPKNLAGMPFQPSDKECGYYVMGYMREIIEDKDTSRFVTKWDKRCSCKYTREYLDEVRNEWADFAVKKYVKKP